MLHIASLGTAKERKPQSPAECNPVVLCSKQGLGFGGLGFRPLACCYPSTRDATCPGRKDDGWYDQRWQNGGTGLGAWHEVESGTRCSQQWQRSDMSGRMPGYVDPGIGEGASNGIADRYVSRGWKSSCRRKQRRQLQREGKEVPPELMPKTEKALTQAQQEQRRMLQQKLNSLQKALEGCETKSETDKTWDSILRTKQELKELLAQPEKATSSAAAPEPLNEQPEQGRSAAAAPEPWDEAPCGINNQQVHEHVAASSYSLTDVQDESS